jgi:hypothetical protein
MDIFVFPVRPFRPAGIGAALFKGLKTSAPPVWIEATQGGEDGSYVTEKTRVQA